MKNLFLICLIFLLGKLSTIAQTITFDDQGYTNNEALGNPYSITNGGETFVFTVSNGGAPNVTNNIYRTDENSCGSAGMGHLYAGNFSATTWTIETSSGNEVNFGTMRFDNVFPCFAFEYNLTIEGFKNGSSTGTQAFTVSGLNNTFNSNSNFDDVDRIVITEGDLANLGIDDIEFEVVLPVELVNFEGEVDEGLKLSWQTASESNNDKFEIEESRDGTKFRKIGEIEGNGTTLVPHKYLFTIEKPQIGLRYYRLKQIDYDGQFFYSKIISLEFKGDVEDLAKIYPNPSQTGQVYLDYVAPKNQEIVISMIDTSGKIVFRKLQEISEGNNNLSFDFSTLDRGLYILEISNEKNTSHQKILIR